MKEKVVALASALVVMGTGGQAWAQSCDSAAKVTSDIWDEVDTFVKIYPCVTVVDCVVKKGSLLTDKLTSFWNAAAGNSWARIGPRKLPFGSTLEGTLVGTGGRMYISFPASETPITVTITETDGKGKASVVICKVDEKNRRTKVATRWFNDTSARKKETREKRSVTVKGVKGEIITVHLDGKSVGNTFGYKIKASK